MSLFTEPKNVNNSLDSDQDVFRLPQHGCDVAFTYYAQNTTTNPASHQREHRCLVVSGKVALKIQNIFYQIAAGEWFHIPGGTAYELEFLENTSLIEFWLDANKAKVA